MLPEGAAFKAAASIVTGTIGIFVLAGNHRRAANVFLASFLFLLAGNQFAETMRALQTTSAGRLFWFRIASVFAFLDPVALYCFGSVFPERNRLNRPYRLGVTLIFFGGLTLLAGGLQLDWQGLNRSGLVLLAWALGTIAVYGLVLREAIQQVHAKPSRSAYAELLPALCVVTVPALARAIQVLANVVPGGDGVLEGSLPIIPLATLAGTVALTLVILREARGLPDPARRARRLLATGAWAGLGFALLSKQGTVIGLVQAGGLELPTSSAFFTLVGGAGDAVKLLAFGVLASAAILRNRMLDLSLGARRWAARVIVGVLVLGGLGAIAVLGSRVVGASPVWAQPGLLVLLAIVLISTQGFRRLVDLVAEKAYGVPRRRQDRIEAYQAAVDQAVEEERGLGSDPRLRRLRDELDLEDRTVHVLERMAGAPSGGPLQPGETIQGRYRIEAFVGRGSSGRIFRAHDELLERDVAIKEVLHGGPHESARALEEARMAGRLEHPNIVTLHDALARPGSSLLVTEYVDGPSLAEVLEADGPMPLDDVLQVLDGILAGLEAVHAEGIVHGDLKPANVLLDHAGTPKLADFGTSRLDEGGTWHASDAGQPPEGTPGYMAPEQRRGEPADRASDLFAVGIIGEEIARQPLPDPIARVLEQARAREPEDRLASATAMRQALREAPRRDLTSGT